jgi:uncharacterized protein
MPTADLNTGLEMIESAECFELLATEEVGRLGVVFAGRPEIFPVNYAVDEDSVVFRTDAGTKLSGSIVTPVVFEVDHIDRKTRSAWSVILHGSAHHVSDHAHSPPRQRVAELTLVPWLPTSRTHLIRIKPTSVTGRRIRAAGNEPQATTAESRGPSMAWRGDPVLR